MCSGFIALHGLQNKPIHVPEGMSESGLSLSKRSLFAVPNRVRRNVAVF
jgi:hypothetical protein